MTLTNISDLPDEDLATKFPQIYFRKMYEQQKSQDDSGVRNIFIDQDANQFYMQKDGSNKATRYNLINANKLIPRPELPEDTHLNADYMLSNWGSLDDESIFDKTNKNWDEIRSYFQAMTRKINYFTDYLSKLGPYLDELAKAKDIDLSDIIADGVDGYYKKSEINKMNNHSEAEIQNIQSKFTTNPNPNGYTPPSYAGGPSADDIDPELDKIEKELGINNY